MKHKKRLFAALLFAVLALAAILAACSTETAVVTFDSAGGSPVEAVTVTVGDTIAEPNAPVRDGYVFAGWYLDNGYTTRFDFTSPVTADTTLYAKWTKSGETPVDPDVPDPDVPDPEPTETTVAYNTNGGTPLLPTVSVFQGGSVQTPANPVRNGYTFGGWYLDPSFANAAAFPFAPAKNSVLYAKWIPESNNVTVQFYYCFQEDNYSYVEHGTPFPVTDKTLTVRPGDKIEQPENPADLVLDGKTMTFSFWCFESSWGGNKGTQPVLFPYVVPEDVSVVTLYAAYVEKKSDKTIRSLTFHRGDGEKNTVMYNYAGETLGSELDKYSQFQPVFSGGARAEPRRAGYKATGYYKTEEFTAENRYEIPFLIPDANADVYIRWESQEELRATFQTEGGSSVESAAFPYNGTIREPETPLKKGYIFDGWYRNKAFDAVKNRWDFQNDAAVKDVTLYAKWVKSPITVAFRSNGGSAVESVSIESDGKIWSLPNVTRTGDADTSYNFYGWFLDEALTVNVSIPFAPAGNATVYAKWSAPIDLTDFVFTYSNYDNGYAVRLTDNAKQTVTNIEIPDSYLGIPVTNVESTGFTGAKLLKSVTIPDSVTAIMRIAFRDCAAFETVAGMKNVLYIYDEAFSGCFSLKRVDFPAKLLLIDNGVFYAVSETFSKTVLEEENDGIYWNDVFLGMKHLSAKVDTETKTRIQSKTGAYQIREGTRVIASYAFESMSKLEEIKIPDTTERFGYSPFKNCTALKKANIPLNFFKNHGNNPFYGCKAMTELTVPDGFNESNKRYVVLNGCLIATPAVTSNGTYVLEYALPTATAIPDCVNVIGTQAFHYNLAKTMIIPNSVTSIGTYAFQSSALTEIDVPDSVGIVGTSAFYGAKDLQRIALGAEVPKLNDTFFTDIKSTKLSSLTVSPKNAVMSAEDNVVYDKQRSKVLYCAPARTNTVYILPETVVSIAKDAFKGAQIEILQSRAKRIDNGLFEANQHLKEVYLSYETEEIAPRAFYNCPELEVVSMTSNLKIIGESAFESCRKLTYVRFMQGLETIGESAFKNSGLTEAILSDSVQSVGMRAFESNNGLLKLHFGAGVSEIGENYGDYVGILESNLTSLTVSEANEHYSAEDLFLYNKNKTVLLCFPQAAKISLEIADTVQEFNLELITLNYYVEHVTFGKSVFTDLAIDEIVAKLKVLQNETDEYTYWNSFAISADHPLLYARNNIVYTKDKTRILGRTPFLNENIVIPKETLEIPQDIFSGQRGYGSGRFDEQNAITLSLEPDSQLRSVASKAFFNGENYVEFSSAASYREIDFTNAKHLSALGDRVFSFAFVKRVLFSSDAPLTYLPENAFWSCSDLTELRLPNAVQELRAGSLGGTVALQTFSVPSGLDPAKIAKRAFWLSKLLTTAENGAEYFNDYLVNIDNATDMEIVVKDGVTAILANAFENICAESSVCAKIYLPASITYAAANNFDCAKTFEILSLAAAPESGDVPNGWDANWIPMGSGVTVTWGATLPPQV